MKMIRWVVAGALVWPVIVLTAAALLGWPWGPALALAYGPILLWSALSLARLGVRNLREAAFQAFGLRRAARKHGWRHEGDLVSGTYRGRAFELVDHGTSIEWDELPDSYRFATSTALLMRDQGELPWAKVTYDQRTGVLRVDGPAEFTEGLFAEWLIARWPAIPGFETEPGTISAPFVDRSTAGLYRLLDFLVDVADRARRVFADDSLEA